MAAIRECKDGDGKAAEEALRKMALCDTTGIPLELLSRSEKEAVGLLTQHALVTKDNKGVVAMHALTQGAVRGLTAKAARGALVAAVVGALEAKLAKFDEHKPVTYFIGRRYASHVRAAAAQAGAWGLLGGGPGHDAPGSGVGQAAGGGGAGARILEDVCSMCMRTGNFFLQVGGQYGQALEMYQTAQDCALALHGPEHLNVAKTHNNMANVYQRQGKYEQALEAYSKSLDIKIKVAGQDSPDVASTYSNIGSVYYSQGRYEEALVQYGKALEIETKVLGSSHLDVA